MKLNLNCDVEYINSFLTKSEAKTLYLYFQKYHKPLFSKFNITMANGEQHQYNYGKMMFIDNSLFEKKKFSPQLFGSNEVWSDEMRLLKERIEDYTKHQFQTCVCIYYPNGKVGVDYHSDFPAFGDTSIIPSISIGAERTFLLKEHKTQRVHEQLLENGSLIIMGNGCQDNYEHALPIDLNCKEPRINITFRKYGFNN